MYVRLYVCMYIRVYVCMYVCVYVCVYVRVYVCMYIRVCVCIYVCTHVCRYIRVYIYRVSQEERTKLREGVSYVKLYRYNSKHLYPKLNGYGDNGKRSLKVWQLLHTY